MPVYEYQCPKCENEFDTMMSLEEYTPIHVCPKCNTPSPRKLSAAQLQSLTDNMRKMMDRNEKAKYEPKRVTKKHQCSHESCDHDHEKGKGSFKQIRDGSRPWMLG